MAASPRARAKLYRKAWLCVILSGAALLAAQSASRQKPEKGPRALALVELAPNGKARLIPVVIMYNGEYYDASAYKASPVPMALEPGTVYEAERAGVSQGLFTITEALVTPNQNWSAAGTWLPAGAKPASVGHKAESRPRDIEPEDAPPVLRRAPEKPKTPDSAAQPAAPAPTTPASPAPPPSSSAPASTTTPPASAPTASTAPASASASPSSTAPQAAEEQDPNVPTLRRGKPPRMPAEKMTAPTPRSAKSMAAAKTGANPAKAAAQSANPAVQTLPAISDAGGPELRPYTYVLKPEEEAQLRKKMLAMAADAVRTRDHMLTSETIGAEPPVAHPAAAAHSSTRRKSAQPALPQPSFSEVQFRAFDLSTNNEPVLVLTANAQMPPGSRTDLQYMIALVARQDIYGELHKVFSSVTDDQHLDALPRYEFVDAVDADGDGRGEMLFRRISDDGSAYSVYRVIGDQIWPLFEGTIGQ